MEMKAKYQSLKEFNKDLSSYRSLDEMFYNLITTLSLICCDGKNYCFCEKYKKPGDITCPLCYIPLFLQLPGRSSSKPHRRNFFD